MREERPLVLQISSSGGPLGGVWRYIQLLSQSQLAVGYAFACEHYPTRHRGVSVAALGRVRRLVLGHRPALVHIHGLQTEGFHLALGAALARCAPVVMTIHGFIEDSRYRAPWRQWLIRHLLEPVALRLVDGFYCVSAFGARKRVTQGRRRGNLGVINNAIPRLDVPDCNALLRCRLRIRQSEVVALCVGRLSWEKGYEYLARAMRQLPRDLPIRVVLVGDGPHGEEIRRCFLKGSGEERTLFVGAQSRVYDYLSMCDFFVLPSLHEHQSFAILEAMMAGKAVLTTTAGGNPELVAHDDNGLLVPPANEAKLAEALIRMAASASLRSQLGKRGRERVLAEFEIGRLVADVHRVYDRVLAEHRSRGNAS